MQISRRTFKSSQNISIPLYTQIRLIYTDFSKTVEAPPFSEKVGDNLPAHYTAQHCAAVSEVVLTTAAKCLIAMISLEFAD